MKAALRAHVLPYLGLLILLTLTATFAGVPLGSLNLPLALAFGSMKTLLVALFFMELKKESNLLRLAAITGLFWLIIFLMLALADYFTRYPGHLLG